MTIWAQKSRRSLVVGTMLALAAMSGAFAQAPATNAPSGFTLNRDLPLKVESTTLEVRDKDRIASFIGNVLMTQGDATVRCKTLVVFYEDTAGPAPKSKQAAPPPAQAQPGGSQRIKRVEARGDVIVAQKDQTATGDLGVFDMRANTVTMTGNVIVTQGKSVVRGDQLVADLTTGRYTMTSKGRVETLIDPNAKNSKDAKSPGPAPAPPPVQRSAPAGPMRLN
jgi:lipopolysaccharide export system protein LptA